jgi:hypothetical protein
MHELARQLECFGWRKGTRITIKRADDEAVLGNVMIRDLLAAEAGDPSDAATWWLARPVKEANDETRP